MADKKTEGASRRDFLRMGVTAAPAAAALAVTSGEAAADEVVETSGLRETDHTRAYLASAKF